MQVVITAELAEFKFDNRKLINKSTLCFKQGIASDAVEALMQDFKKVLRSSVRGANASELALI